MSTEVLGRAEIRAALHEMQCSRCAVCGTDGKLVVDHDHATGLARGLLCRSCNNREGGGRVHADIEAYLASPPAAGRNWFWTFPDTWTVVDTAAVWRRLPGVRHSSGIPISVILEHIPEHLERVAAMRAAAEQRMMAAWRHPAMMRRWVLQPVRRCANGELPHLQHLQLPQW